MPSEKSDRISPGAIFTPEGSRRRFFQWVTSGVMGVIGFALAVPLIGYVVSPTLKRREKTWVDVGDVNEVPVGEPDAT